MIKETLLASVLAIATISSANAYAVMVPEHHAHTPVVHHYHPYVPPAYYYHHHYRHWDHDRAFVR